MFWGDDDVFSTNFDQQSEMISLAQPFHCYIRLFFSMLEKKLSFIHARLSGLMNFDDFGVGSLA